MFNQISYNVVIERFKVFADGHFMIRRFSHGQVDVTDIDKDQLFPWMHVAPVDVRLDAGARVYSFDVIFADMPRDKEDATDYQREVICDCVRLCEDLVNEIANGLVVFGEDVELEEGSTITPFIAEYTHTLCGATLAISISVPNDYSACDIPADWSIGGSGSATPPSPSVPLVLKVNGVENVVQDVLDLVQDTGMVITDLGDGRVRFESTGGGGGSVAWGAITGTLSNQIDMQNALDLKADISSLGAVAFSNDYNDLDNLPTIPTELNDLTDVNVSSPNDGDTLIYFSGGSEFKNQPLATVATTGDYTDLINQPSIPTNLDDLADVNAPTPTNGQVLSYNGTQWVNSTPSTGGTVTSVGLTMPSAFSVSGSPVTTAGTLAVTGAGTTEQYVRGDGSLANFPSTGGGGGQIFYFNGNVSQGTIGGNQYYELGTEANTGPAANFTRATTGAIARFITDVGAPDHLLIPAGVWTIDVYLSETGGGSNHAQILAKLYKYDGTNFTLIATSTMEEITNGSTPDLYTFTISVPSTVTLATDRIHIEFDIQNTNGKTVTLYTEDGRIGEVHSTYAIGISSLNGLTSNTQSFATGTSGTDFAISSAASTHTFNLPTASASARGALSSADWSTFNGKQNSIGLTTVGTNLATLPNPSAISYLRINADNTIAALSLASLKSELGLSAVTFKATNQSSNVTSYADINDLNFAVVSGKKYRFKIVALYDASNTSTGSRWSINSTVTFSQLLYYVEWSLTAAGGSTRKGYTTYDEETTANATSAFTTGNVAVIEGVIVPTSSGTINARFASELTITSITCKAGSYVEWEEVL